MRLRNRKGIFLKDEGEGREKMSGDKNKVEDKLSVFENIAV